MKMNGIEDFMTPQCMDIAQPNHGFFGYLLRCKCLSQEDVSGDFIFIDDGTDCFVRFPSVKSHREIIRTEWNARTGRYHDFFQGMLFYVNEDRIEDFADFMTDSPGRGNKTIPATLHDRGTCRSPNQHPGNRTALCSVTYRSACQ